MDSGVPGEAETGGRLLRSPLAEGEGLSLLARELEWPSLTSFRTRSPASGRKYWLTDLESSSVASSVLPSLHAVILFWGIYLFIFKITTAEA